MTSIDHEESRLRDLYLTKYICKNVELKVIKNILSVNYDILQREKAALKEEYKKLENVNYSVWAIEDQFCNEIWNFSLEHNFNVFFNQYPDIMEVVKLHNCKCNIAVHNNIENIDVHKENILTELKNEIDIVSNEITFVRNKNVAQDVKNATLILDNLKLFSEEILDLIRLVGTSENSQNIHNISTYQQSNRCVAEGFISSKKLIKKSNFHFNVLIGKKVTAPLNTIIEKPKKCYNIKDNIKFGKFVMKKQSLISLKFEQNPRN